MFQLRFRKTKRIAMSIWNQLYIRFKDLPQEEGLKIWGITSLEERMTRRDLIKIKTTVNSLESIDRYSGL